MWTLTVNAAYLGFFFFPPSVMSWDFSASLLDFTEALSLVSVYTDIFVGKMVFVERKPILLFC